MPWIFVRHKVEDYSKWKPIFDEHGTTRKAIGSKRGYLFRSIDDTNEVLMFIEVDDLENVIKFLPT
ncbi:MAG: hypothetical protein GTN76_14455 [Candidatus Aenigmarchaeota archaeon]|nr:hypothetical protein [Candidatus Aenigmarchaeota archaeon]